MKSGEALIEALESLKRLAFEGNDILHRTTQLEILSTYHKILIRNEILSIDEVEAHSLDQKIIDLKIEFFDKEKEIKEAINNVDLCSRKNIIMVAEPIGETFIEPVNIEDRIGLKKTRRIQDLMTGKKTIVKVKKKVYRE